MCEWCGVTTDNREADGWRYVRLTDPFCTVLLCPTCAEKAEA